LLCLNAGGDKETVIFETGDEQRNDARDVEEWCAITAAFMEN
jgi:hypothetical protein